MSSFDKEDDRAKLVVPKSVNDGKVVKLSQKTLKTRKVERKVLPEERYVGRLERIIEKDYFPELKKMKVQKEYLDAVAAKDVEKIKELQIKFCSGASVRTDRSMITPSTTALEAIDDDDDIMTPAPFDSDTPGPSQPMNVASNEWLNTPLPYANLEGDNDAVARNLAKKKNVSLTEYLNKYTSEDNASFEELTKVMREREDAKRKWLYDAEKEHNKNLITQHAIAADADVQLALKDAPDADKNRPLNIDNWKYTAWNTVLFNPDGAALTPAEAMEASKKQQIEINRKATRFPEDMKQKPSDEAMHRAALNHAINNVGKVDVLGREVTPNDAMKLLATPNPDPEVMDSPLMTWGEIDGTPFRLDGFDISEANLNGSGPTFKIPEIPYREKIAQTMNDSIGAKYRDKRKIAMKAAEIAHKSPSFGTNRGSTTAKLSQLSPAAQKLATKKLGLKMSTKSPFLSPKSNNKWTRTPGSDWSRSGGTPGSSWSQGARTPGTPNIGEMIRKKKDDPPTPKHSKSKDDQLDPKRPSAGDFF